MRVGTKEAVVVGVAFLWESCEAEEASNVVKANVGNFAGT